MVVVTTSLPLLSLMKELMTVASVKEEITVVAVVRELMTSGTEIS